MKKYILLILTIVLEIVTSTYLSSYISPIFTYLYVILISNNIKNKYQFLIISGIIYDTILSTYFIHTFLFLIINFIKEQMDKRITRNAFITFINFIIYLFLYRIISFIIFMLIKYKEISIDYFIESITISLLNIIFYYIIIKLKDECKINDKAIL